MFMSTHKTRLAPTPSGYLHLGNVLSFAITTAIAVREGATVLLRIDDMDRDRVVPAYVQDVFDTLHYLHIPWQEGPVDATDFERAWSQRHRLPLYDAALRQLAESGHVYACTCSRAQILRDSPDGTYPGTCRHKGLPLDTPGAAWRLYTDATAAVQVRTLHGAAITATLPPLVHDLIVRKKDGYPAYQLSSVIDDTHYGIDTIVRGQDLWDSTLAQLYLARLLGIDSFSNTRFHHHPLLTNTHGDKLSKSAGDTSVQYLRSRGATLQPLLLQLCAMAGIKDAVNDIYELGEALLRAQDY